MSLVLLISIPLTVVAGVWSFVLQRQQRDWRPVLLTLFLLLIAAWQTTTLVWAAVERGTWAVTASGAWKDMHEAVIACMALLMVVFLQSMLSARQRTKPQLYQATDRLSIILESLPVISYTCRVTGDFGATFVSNNVQPLTGYAPDDFTSRPSFWVERIHPEDRQRVLAGLKGLAEKESYEHEYRWRIADGSYRWIYDFLRLAQRSDGSGSHIVGMWQDITGRTGTVEALRDSEVLHHSLVENLPQYIFRKDLNCRITFCNQRYCELWGKLEEELVGRTSFDLFPAHLARKYEADERRVMETGEIYEAVEERPGENGESISLQVVKTPIADARGNVVGVQGIFWDISEQARAEKALRDSEALYHSLVENLPQNIFRKDLNHRVTFGNQRYCETSGRSLDEMLGKDDFDLYPHELARKYQADDRWVMETGKIFETVEENQLPDGKMISVQVVKTPVHDASGAIVGVQGIFWDITDRVRAEEALRESEERFRQMAENIHDVFRLTDWSSGRVLYVSPAYSTIWGHSCRSLYEWPRSWLDAVHPEDRDRVTAAYDQHTARGNYSEQFRIVRADGSIRWIRDNAFPITDTEGKVYRIAGISEDITERHEAEEKLSERDDALAHVTRLSTMGEMVAGIAHEINQPLYAISNFATACTTSLLSNGKDQKTKLLDWTQQITEQATRAGQIIRRLGNYARKTPTRRNEVDLNELVHESVELVAAEARRSKVQVEMQLAQSLPMAIADAIQIQQVLVNLIRNAFEASDSLELARRWVLVRTSCEGAEIHVEVEDGGAGLPPGDPDRLFDAFYSTKTDGMGMGLAISRTIVESHHGRIWALPREPLGATFHFSLPVTEGVI